MVLHASSQIAKLGCITTASRIIDKDKASGAVQPAKRNGHEKPRISSLLARTPLKMEMFRSKPMMKRMNQVDDVPRLLLKLPGVKVKANQGGRKAWTTMTRRRRRRQRKRQRQNHLRLEHRDHEGVLGDKSLKVYQKQIHSDSRMALQCDARL